MVKYENIVRGTTW